MDTVSFTVNHKNFRFKENKGLKILKEDGMPFNHNGEWRNAKESFLNLFGGGKDGKIFPKLNVEEMQIWEHQVGNVSDVWEQYDAFIEKTKHLNKLKPALKE